MGRWCLIVLMAALVSVWGTWAAAAPWETASTAHPFGTDEFGRDVLSTLVLATANSIVQGAVATVVALSVALLVSYGIVFGRIAFIDRIMRVGAMVIESVPIIIWIMILVVALKDSGLSTTVIGFSLAVLPLVSNAITGELRRLRHSPFVEAAALAGASRRRLLFSYMLPNGRAVLVPLAIQLFGLALAIDGAIGLLGVGSRSDLDLGTFLIRGKENIQLHPHLLGLTLLAFVGLYGILSAIRRYFERQRSGVTLWFD